MVMAGNEAAPGALSEDSLSGRLQWLKQRREALQKKLAQKNNELKNLCVEEAELTGVLPPEIPLEPGESPPIFRRKVGTSFTYPQNLINKLKTNEAEESALELERQVQIGIVEAALAIVNDPTESKAVRRKHRLVYQQSQHRLQELEARLNFIRQSRGKSYRPVQTQQPSTFNTQSQLQNNVKHRTKKPRPPLDGAANDGNMKQTRSLIQEDGISLSPLGTEDKCNTYPGHAYDDQLPLSNSGNQNRAATYCPTSPIGQRQNIKIIEHDHNDNQNVYILPDQYRGRTYSHGSGGSRSHYQDSERTYRPVPNTYTEEERQLRYRQFQQMQLQDQVYNHQQYPEYKHLDNDIHRRSGQNYYERDFRTMHYSHVPDIPVYYKSNSQLQPLQRRERDVGVNKNLQYTSSSSEAVLPPGYWMRYEDEIVWCSDEQTIPDRFGSLDRRKRNALQHTASAGADVQPRYRTVSIGYNKNSNCTPPHQNVSVHYLPLSDQSSTSNKMLLRTQSLGSVESRQSSHSRDLHEGKDMLDNVSRKVKEKEWYETSLDSGTSPGLDLSLMASRKSPHYQPSPSVCVKIPNSPPEDPENNYLPPVNRRKPELIPVESEQLPQHPPRQEQPRKKVLEIPAESKPSPDINEETIALGSSQNCTIVHAGKYQPYREVTKPFEMSDFYKYSTKFRKRNEAANQAVTSETQDDSRGNRYTENNDVPAESSSTVEHNGTIAGSVQKRIYQPVQRMTCQPYMTTLR